MLPAAVRSWADKGAALKNTLYALLELKGPWLKRMNTLLARTAVRQEKT